MSTVPAGRSLAAYNTTQVMMELAGIAYAPQASIETYLGQPNFGTDGWQLAWGPATDDDAANLAYIARNAATDTYAVAIRGTYPEFGFGFLYELLEDLDVFELEAWQYPAVPTAAIAGGTADALRAIGGMQSSGLGLMQYLKTQVLSTNAEILVTGHSLGGCLASVVAPWLAYELKSVGSTGTVRPYTYAAPTAGNAAFAQWESAHFAGVRVYNTLDLVPMAWADLLLIPNLYPSLGPACPAWFVDVVKSVHSLVSRLQYAQPTAGAQPVTGTVLPEGDFFEEAADQHAHNTYLSLLHAPTLPFLVESTRVTWSQMLETGQRELIGEVHRRRTTAHAQWRESASTP